MVVPAVCKVLPEILFGADANLLQIEQAAIGMIVLDNLRIGQHVANKNVEMRASHGFEVEMLCFYEFVTLADARL